MRYWPKVSIYHSHLSKYTSEHGGLPCRLVSDVMPSKNKDGSKIVRLNPHGDETEYWLALENPACAAVAEGLPKNEWFTLEAHGARDSATLRAIDVHGNDITPEVGAGYPAPSAPPSPWDASAPFPPEAPRAPTVTHSSTFGGGAMAAQPDLRARMVECIKWAVEIIEQFEVEHARTLDEHERQLAVSLFIERNRKGF